MINASKAERQSLQNAERRILDERRLRQSCETQLNAERKQRKQAEEKATRYVSFLFYGKAFN